MTKICLDNLTLPLGDYDRASVGRGAGGKYNVNALTKGLGVREQVAHGLTHRAALEAAVELNRILIAHRKMTT